jgi:hypothetical protein
MWSPRWSNEVEGFFCKTDDMTLRPVCNDMVASECFDDRTGDVLGPVEAEGDDPRVLGVEGRVDFCVMTMKLSSVSIVDEQ